MVIAKRRPCFFGIFSSSMTPTRLKIPVSFMKHMEGRTSGSVSLVGPSGNVWSVQLVKNDDDVFLDHGWPTFVRDHLIACGDLLVFRYDGGLCFTVQVFDQSACEKESAFHSKCSEELGKSCRKRGREEEGVFSGEISECNAKKAKESCFDFLLYSAENEKGTRVVVSTKETCHYDDAITIARYREEIVRYGSLLNSPAMPSQLNSDHGKPDEMCLDFESEATTRRRIGKDDELNLPERGPMSTFSEREKKVAESFISCYPYFVRVMKKFNISGSYTLNIPYKFSMAHLPNCRTEIVLLTVKGASWTVNSVPTTRVHTSHTLCGGWMTFVRNNDIKVGDICIFELVCKLEMRVFILRVGKDCPENQSGKAFSKGMNTGAANTSPKSETSSKKSRRHALDVHSKIIEKAETCDKKRTRKNQAIHTKKYDNGLKGCASFVLGPQSISGNNKHEMETGLRMLLALDEAKAAKSFTSGFPNFVRIMRKFNVSGSYTLKIPHQFSTAYLPNLKTEILLRNFKGIVGLAVHTFCGGWMAFARDNGLQIGDICMFELVSKYEMCVHISGAGRKSFGDQSLRSASADLPVGGFSSNYPPV
ncbi:hypothetical protein K2173_026748 [Erythroxylum novogranatense]|uniref:TF-B3 domain-containing protein n=1 Tax=Erythroxylum novogranatense TaxID=1862640 RepID=A0AAV8TYF2_9ROSI|nr:hypothetical protein K2173_026748 [Erythroxylum novogranatense]